MRIAGVRLADGRMVWADAGAIELRPLDRVVVRLSEGDVECSVFVTPEQMIKAPTGVSGRVIRVAEPRKWSTPAAEPLPGSEMPPLGTRFRSPAGEGTVVRLDPVGRTITVRLSESEDVQVQL